MSTFSTHSLNISEKLKSFLGSFFKTLREVSFPFSPKFIARTYIIPSSGRVTILIPKEL